MLFYTGYDVKLLDGSPNPGGLSTGWRTKEGKAVEAGMKGFWYQVRLELFFTKSVGHPHVECSSPLLLGRNHLVVLRMPCVVIAKSGRSIIPHLTTLSCFSPYICLTLNVALCLATLPFL